jgi:hypothetical protein
VAGLLIVRKCLKSAMHADTKSTMMAINAALVTDIDKNNTKVKEIFVSGGEEWQFLDPKDYDIVIQELAKSHNLDPSPKASDRLVDRWGNRFEIAYQKTKNGIYDFFVISKGPDRIYGTDDDIVSGYGVVPPKKLEN